MADEPDLYEGDTETIKSWLRPRIDDGVHCPACEQFAKVYRRKINSTMARALISLYQAVPVGHFAHGPSLPGDTHEISQLGWWDLVEEELARREDGGRAGWWRITPVGEQFVLGQHRVAKYARIYDGRCLSLVGDPVSITDALGNRFNYRDLMDGV